MTETHPSFCRMCHSACPILVDVDDGVAVKVSGDPSSEIYHGYTCIKGRALPEMHAHPDRLLHSLARQPDGSFAPIASERAMDEIAASLTRIVGEHGPLAVALYSGTFGLANALTAPLTNAFREALGNPRGWVATSIDQPGKTIAQGLMGVWMALHQGPATADVCMIIGSNPLISIAAGLPQADPRKWLHDAKQRGFKLIVVDPRRHETASQADIYLQPKPAEDIAIVGGMIRLIVDEGLYDHEFVAAETQGLDELRRAVDPFDPATVARRADIPVDDFVAAARLFATAGRGVAVAGTGPGMSSARGTLLEYMILALNALCGRYLRAGELVWNPGTLVEPVPRFAQASGPFPAYGFEPKLRVRGLGDTLVGPSTAAIADEILEPGQDQIRALISCGGNPLSAWPDQLRVREALESVELLVQFDPWMSSTAKLADYVIAPTLSLEVPGMTNYVDMLPAYAPGYGLPKPWAQYTAAVVAPPPGSDVIPEWEFFYGLAQRMGLALEVRPVDFNGPTGATMPIPMDVKPTADTLLDLLTTKARIPLGEIKKFPNGAVFEEPSSVVQPKMDGWEARLELANDLMMRDLAEMSARPSGDLASWAGDAYPFRLVGRRMNSRYNSGGMTAPRLQSQERTNPAFMHPDDLEALGLSSGDIAEISSARATILGVVAADETIRRGLVAMSHAWGDVAEHDEEVRNIGGNTSRLIDVTDQWDPYSGQPIMSNIPVTVRAHEGARGQRGPLMAVDDDAPYPNPLDATSGPTTQWTRNNVGEAFPGVVTPLHYDFVVRAGELGIRGAYAERGAITAEEAAESDVADERVMAAFKGRLAVNVDTMCAFGDRVSETAAAEIEFGLLGFVREGVTRHPSTDRHALIAERDAEVRAGIDARAQGLYTDVEHFWRGATGPDVLADVAGAPDRWREARVRFLEGAIVMTHVTTFAGEAFVALLTACATAGRPELLARLNGGYGDTHDDEMSAALWSLAHGDTSMDEFLHEYGYQGNRAADLYATVWREDPDLLRPILATMASMPKADGPAATGATRVADRVAAEGELLDALTGADRDAAERAIADARHFTVLREQVKVVSQRSLDVARAAARTLGRDLAASGALDAPDDVFHLVADEFVTGRAPDLRARVAYRKELASGYESVDLPVLFVGNPSPTPLTDAAASEAVALEGLGVSPGVVEGVARVIVDPATSDPLEPGEILVCSATDPSWVGHFLVAAALVIDVGGPMSHGAIVARELGVPCVINTVVGTSSIRTGDTVRIDGSAGTVEIVQRAAA